MTHSRFFAIVALSFVTSASAQVKVSENILRAEPDMNPVPGTLGDVSWMVGSWYADAWGGSCREVWAPSLGSSMMGMFQFSKSGQTQFYEFITIIEEEDSSMALRIKHFSKAMEGWEHKDTSQTFRLVKLEAAAVYFNTQTYKKIDENTMMVYFLVRRGGETKEESFRYVRQ